MTANIKDENGNYFLYCPKCDTYYKNYEYIDSNVHACADWKANTVPKPIRAEDGIALDEYEGEK